MRVASEKVWLAMAEDVLALCTVVVSAPITQAMSLDQFAVLAFIPRLNSFCMTDSLFFLK